MRSRGEAMDSSPQLPRKPTRRKPEPGEAPPPPAPTHSTFHFGVYADKNYPSRRTMEDTFTFAYDFDGIQDQGLFAVFDGHGGKSAAKWCSDHYPTSLAKMMGESEDVAMALCNSFTNIDSQLTPENGIHSGCTAIVSLLMTEKGTGRRMLHSANVGDARAVLFRDGQAIRLSYDHKGSDPQEQKRVKASGGFISNQRVNGLLAVTRSLGDHEMKDYVIGTPYTTSLELDPLKDTILVLACDGVWDILEDQQVCEMADGFKDPAEAAKAIAMRAMAEGSSDNISIIVVYLQRRDH